MKIIGTGSALPSQVVTNDMLSEILDTNDEWISTRTGIKQRRIINEDRIDILAADAAKKALTQANLEISDIDFLLCSAVKTQYTVPGVSAIVAKHLGATCPSLDLNAGCSGYIYALYMAKSLLATGHKNILVVCAETPTKLIDWADRSVAVLFGDAAAATVVTASEDEFDIKLNAKYDSDVLYAHNEKGNSPYSAAQPEKCGLFMDGQEVYKYAVFTSISDIEQLLQSKGKTPSDVSKFILHQANYRIVDAVRKRMKLAEEAVPTNMQLYGNTSSTSIPLLLDELNKNGELKQGDLLAMSAFGAGLLSGVALFRWAI